MKLRMLFACVLFGVFFSIPAGAEQAGGEDLFDLSIEELMNLEVVSASKKSQSLSKTPAAVFVITQDDIRRSGATQLPELFRMVPGLHVGRIDSGAWAVSARGFVNRFANKLLVLIDGRAIYLPMFSGVYWSMHEPVLQDIERIEVVRGPGGALWGANAMNGIINIITKNTEDTQGGMLTAAAGTHERGLGAFRFGEALDDETYYRIYAKYIDLDENQTPDGDAAGDFRRAFAAGWRMDAQLGEEASFSFHGGFTHADEEEPNSLGQPGEIEAESYKREADSWSGYLLGKGTYGISEDSVITLSSYLDMNRAEETRQRMYPPVFSEYSFDTFDVELQHNYRFAANHDLIYGAGFRLYSDSYEFNYPSLWYIEPSADDYCIVNIFAQDRIDLYEDLQLTLGAKYEYSEAMDWELQPTARLLWQPFEDFSFWAAVSRAVRTPSRHQHDAVQMAAGTQDGSHLGLDQDALILIQGNKDADAASVTAYELGTRIRPHRDIFFDVAAFYNEYEGLLHLVDKQPVLTEQGYVIQSMFDNMMDGSTYGFEVACSANLLAWWRVQAAYAYTHAEMESDSELNSPRAEQHVQGYLPHNTLHLRSHMDFPHDLALDLTLRYVDEMPFYNIPSYWEADLRLGWKPYENLELELVGRNLIQDGHLEAVGDYMPVYPVEIQRSLHMQATLYF